MLFEHLVILGLQEPMQHEDYLAKIGSNITRIRKEKGLTTVQLGDLCDMEKSNLIPIEKGRINVTMLTLAKIASALEVNVVDFFTDQ